MHPTTQFLFDLDGTLIDSRRAVRESYRRAGITLPDDVWGKPWREWCPPEIHREKVRLYPHILRMRGRVLRAATIAEMTGATVLTGASRGAGQAAEDLLGFALSLSSQYEMTLQDKEHHIGVLLRDVPVVYVDDNHAFGQRLLRTYNTSQFTFVHVTVNDELIIHRHDGRTSTWMLSYWRPVATSV